jgi:SAM-dependent methyltransferase
VLRVARRELGLDALGVEVVEADARDYLARLRQRFDLIVEDVFVGRGRAVHKPDWLAGPALGQLAQRLAPGGLLVSNALDEAPASASEFARIFPVTLCLSVADFDNRVLVGGPTRISALALRGLLAREPLLAPALPRLRVRTLSRTRAAARGLGAAAR